MAEVRKRKTRKIASKPEKKGAVKELSLPQGMRPVEHNLMKYVLHLYGRPGIGKTTLAASFPDCILFSCERVSKGIEAYDFNWENGGVTDWRTFKKGVSLVKESDFQTVGVDTVEAAYRQCRDYICKQRGISHPSEERDYGATWDAVRNEFINVLTDIHRSGRGLVLLSHSADRSIDPRDKESYTRVQPALTNQGYEVIKSLTDFLGYIEFFRHMETREHTRVLITLGDELIDAKAPPGFPNYVDLTNTIGEGYKRLQEAFQGDYKGINVGDITATKSATSGVSESLRRRRAGGGKKKQVTKRKTT